MGAAWRTIRPRQAAFPGGTLSLSCLLAPQLATCVHVGHVGTVAELLAKGLPALAVQAVCQAWRLAGQGEAILRCIQ